MGHCCILALRPSAVVLCDVMRIESGELFCSHFAHVLFCFFLFLERVNSFLRTILSSVRCKRFGSFAIENDGTLIIADWYRPQLLVFHPSGHFKQAVPVSGRACSLCRRGDGYLFLTLQTSVRGIDLTKLPAVTVPPPLKDSVLTSNMYAHALRIVQVCAL